MTPPGDRPQGLISLREVVSIIAAKTGTEEVEAAAMLADYPFSNPNWFGVAMYEWQPIKGCRRLSNDDRMSEAIAVLDEWGRGEISQASLHGMDDGRRSRILDRVGFRRSDVLPLVEGIEESPPVTPPSALATGCWPHWKHGLAEFEYLTDEEAAAALAGVDLSEFDSHLPYEQEEFRHLRELIRRSCEGGNLPAKILRVDDDGNQEWTIKPRDFAMWCDSRGIPYPLPGRGYLEQPESESKASIALEEEIRRLRDLLQAKEEALGGVMAERDRLKTDFLERKSRTTALKIIGGLIAANYKLDIHSDRLNGIQAIERDLDTVRCSVDPKTLRELIKEAATVVPPSDSPGGK